ncbi:MAG: hypothetical protein QOG34_447 [Frankiaceae bacterium]|nr:hypothetical protein [Frankiaceae bacterium]
MKPVGVEEIADELYGLPPDEFTKARDDAARAATDPVTAKAIKALRKPTVPAHVVNRLVRERPVDVDELLALGEQLRAAMAGGGGDVRQLTEHRRALVGSLVPAGLPAAVQSEVTATLEAATADPELAAAVRAGHLVKPLRYTGFGGMATPPTTTKSTPPSKPAKADPKELDAARRRVLDLAGTADDAQRRYEAAVRAVVDAREQLEAAEAERAEAHRAAKAAHAEAEKARRELGRLERS